MIKEILQSLPFTAHTLIIGAFILGLLLWVYGRASTRLAFAAIGSVLGGATGCFLPATFGLSIDAWITTVLGIVIGLIVGMTALRFAVSLTLGVLLATASPFLLTGALAISEAQPAPVAQDQSDATQNGPETPEAEKFFDESPIGVPFPDLPGSDTPSPGGEPEGGGEPAPGGDTESDGGAGGGGAMPGEVSETIEEGTARIRAFVTALHDEFRPHWDALSQQRKILYVGSTVLAFVVGVGLGMFAPKKSSGTVTAFVGAAIWIPAGIWMMNLFDWTVPAFFPESPRVWLLVWFVVGLLGMAVQWGRQMRRKRKREKE